MKFENNVQFIKHEVLKEVAKQTMEGTLKEEYVKIPKKIIKGPKPITRCCIHKERAIIQDRVELAMGGDQNNPNIMEVLTNACDECPINRFTITEACRGCLAHRCSEACPVGAIFHVGQRAYINQEKCIECGRCRDACQYNAVSDVRRPCRGACPTNAISLDEDKKAVIDNEKCIQCGVCMVQCPFGAIMDKSFITHVIDLLKNKNEEQHVYAIIAPAIASQFKDITLGQVMTGIKALGFYDVVEAALGADMVTANESLEFVETIDEKKVMTTSCCPAFVSYIKKQYPDFFEHVSTSVSPMIALSRLIKKQDAKAKVVFIGPCTAKKGEANLLDIKESTDYVLTFEELRAMIDAASIDLNECEESPLEQASFFGRIFARSGGVTEAIEHIIAAKEIDVEFKPVRCDGIKECDKALKIAKVGRLQGNFIEGMACKGGCIGGAASLCHEPKSKKQVDAYGELAKDKGVLDILENVKIDEVDMHRHYDQAFEK